MRIDNRFPLALLWIILAVLVLVVLGLFLIIQGRTSSSPLPVLGHLPEFQFTERSGRAFGLAGMKGRINVVDFIFTNCPDICPVMSGRMSELYRLFADADNVRFVSISVDPGRDSLNVLREYAVAWGVTDERWVFLRGPIEEVAKLSEEGFMLSAAELPMGHSARFVLVDPDCRIRGYYDSFDDASIEDLKADIRRLIEARQ